MPLQNRVDPFGRILAVSARGMFTGNRGVIHDPETRTLLSRRWTTRAWLVCTCEWKGRRREPMGRNGPGGVAGWTELFFLDEVTALSAGHRPCFFCRREQARDFALRFGQAFGIAGPKAAEIDGRLHTERLASVRQPRQLSDREVRSLPDGAMIALDAKPLAVRRGALLPWSFAGYGDPLPARRSLPAPAVLLTPPTNVAVLRAGYRPVWHEGSPPSAPDFISGS